MWITKSMSFKVVVACCGLLAVSNIGNAAEVYTPAIQAHAVKCRITNTGKHAEQIALEILQAIDGADTIVSSFEAPIEAGQTRVGFYNGFPPNIGTYRCAITTTSPSANWVISLCGQAPESLADDICVTGR